MIWAELVQMYDLANLDLKAAIAQGIKGTDMESIRKDARERLTTALDALSPESIRELESILSIPEKRDEQYQAADIFNQVGHIPQQLFDSIIRAAVYEPNPSFNRYFIDPCVAQFGNRKVVISLLEHVKTGTNFEKAGAVNALYWALPSSTIINGQETEESKRLNKDLGDISDEMHILLLSEFVHNDDLDVRRSIIPAILGKDRVYAEDLKQLAERARRIALAYPATEYIHQRVLVNLGIQEGLPCKPERG